MAQAKGSRGSGGFFYLFLANPASVFRVALNSQLGREIELADVFPWLSRMPDNIITEYWMLFAIPVQIMLSALLLRMAARRLEPCKRKRRR